MVNNGFDVTKSNAKLWFICSSLMQDDVKYMIMIYLSRLVAVYPLSSLDHGQLQF